MFGAVIVVAKHRLHVFNGELLFGLEVDRIRAAFVGLLFKARVEELLDLPDARVVVDAVAGVVTGVGLGEVEFAVLLRIVEAVLFSPAHERLGGHEVAALGVVLLQTALVAGSEVRVLRGAVGKPLVARAGFEVPDFLRVDEDDAEAFAGADRFNDGAENGDAFARGLGAGEDHVMNVVLGDPRLLVVRIKLQGLGAGEDGFRGGNAHAGLVVADGAVELRLPVGNRGVAHAVLRERIFEVRRAVVVLGAVHAGLVVLGRMDHEVLGLEGIAVGGACDEEGSVGGGALAHDNGRAGKRGCGKRGGDGERQCKLSKEHDVSPCD